MNRRTFYWKLRNSELALGERTLIMGVLNVTPDSFSDGGLFRDPDRAYARALELEEQGADIIDIGAESTRPGSSRISADEEWQRLVPVLKRLRGNLHVPLSIDTYKSETATRAMDYGVEIINDPSGLTFDAALAKSAASANAGLILNHMRGTPESWAKLAPLPDAPSAVTRDLEATVNRARRAGVEQNRIVVDPGLGFGKRGEQNAEILAHLGELARLELPVLVGPSRKSFLRQKAEDETIFATAAAVAAAILKGAHIVRVHDVKEMRAVVLVTDEIARAGAVLRVSLERPVQRPKAARPPVRDMAGYNEQRPTRPPLLRRPEPEPAPEIPVARTDDADQTKPPEASVPSFDRDRDRPAADRPRDDGRTNPPQRTGPPRDREFRGRDTERTQRDRPAADRPRDDGRTKPPQRTGPPRDREFRGRNAERTQRDRPAADRPRDDGRTKPPQRTGPPRDREFRGRDTERTQSGRPAADRPRDAGRTKPPQRTGPPRDREFRGRDTERTQSGRPAGDRPRDAGRKEWRGDRGPRSGPGNRDRSGPPRKPDGSAGPPRSDQRKGDRPPKRVFRKRP
jgi:dihydropteroate synthase